MELWTIDEPDVRDWVGLGNLSKGKRLAARGDVFERRRRERQISARVRGRHEPFYILHVELGRGGIMEAHCSCRAGSGGRCKHVAAALWSWLQAPEQFVASEEIEPELESMSREELVVLVRLMLRRDPALESLLSLLPRRTQQEPFGETIERFRAEATLTFTRHDPGWRQTHQLGRELAALEGLSRSFERAGQPRASVAVNLGLIAAILENYADYEESDDTELVDLLQRCCRRTERCLPEIQEGAIRSLIWEQLAQVIVYVVERGEDLFYEDLGLDREIWRATARQAGAAERRALLTLLRQRLPAWARESSEIWDNWELWLRRDELDEASFEASLRARGLWGDLLEHLILGQRWEEGAAIAQEATVAEQILFAERLLREDAIELAEALLVRAEQHWPAGKPREEARDLLFRLYRDQDRLEDCLALAGRGIAQRPTMEGLHLYREAARALDRWPALLEDLREDLEERGHLEVLSELLLEEDRPAQALELAAAHIEEGRIGSWAALQVAELAWEQRPLAALTIYQREVEELIGRRSRPDYVEACGYLRRVARCFAQADQAGRFEEYLAEICERYSRRRALLEEIERANLTVFS